MISIDFERFNKAGLKPILDKFEKASLPVAGVEADNKAKRDSGYLVKAATVNFESGQKLLLKAKAGGSIYQVRLNNKVLAIKNYADLDKAIVEVIGYVKENEKNYQKQREKQLARTKVIVPKIKAANSSVAEQITQLQTTINETTAANQELDTQINDVVLARSTRATEASVLESDLDNLVAAGNALQTEYNALKEGIAS